MQNSITTLLQRLISLLAGLLILRVTVSVVLKYVDYFPASFQSEFLHGRQDYFAGAYHWAFYTHILSGPVALVAGLLLISERFRQRLPKWHRRLGRVHGLNVLCLLAPSGLWMAFYAAPGSSAQVAFVLLALATAGSVALGWRAAVRRQYQTHRRWMTRNYVLLCSAVVIRVIGGLASVTYPMLWIDEVAPWACWIIPLAALELRDAGTRRRIVAWLRPTALHLAPQRSAEASSLQSSRPAILPPLGQTLVDTEINRVR
jgi:hypothetical protein